jgi:hypothetical protein
MAGPPSALVLFALGDHAASPAQSRGTGGRALELRDECLSVQRPGVKLGPSKVLSEDVGSLDLSDIGVVVDRGVRAGAQAYLGPRPEGWLLGR